MPLTNVNQPVTFYTSLVVPNCAENDVITIMIAPAVGGGDWTINNTIGGVRDPSPTITVFRM